MILKTLTHDHGNQDVWNWYDNIDSASAYFDEENQMAVVAVHFKDVDANITIAIDDVAFLCNDNGQTIECEVELFTWEKLDRVSDIKKAFSL